MQLCKRCHKREIDNTRSKRHCSVCADQYLMYSRNARNKLNYSIDKRNKEIESLENGLCKSCHFRPIWYEHSQNYCKHCFLIRKQGNTKHRLSHLKPKKIRIYRTAEQKAETDRLYRQRNKFKLSENSRLWRMNNLERNNKNQREWALKNPDKIRGYVKTYNKNHPEMVTKSSRRRREQFKLVEGNFTKKEWDILCKKFHNTCLWCGTSKSKLTIDHVIPITKGGTNYIENLQPLCARCNSRKGSKILDFRPFGSAILDWT